MLKGERLFNMEKVGKRGRKNCCTITSLAACLNANLTPSQTAKKLKVSERTVWNNIALLRLKGWIKQLTKYPATFQVIIPASDSATIGSVRNALSASMDASRLDSRRVGEPHRFGCKFKLEGEWVWGGKHSWTAGGGTVCREWELPDGRIRVTQGKRGRQSISIHLKAFKGLKVLDQIVLGNERIVQIANEFAGAHGCIAVFEKKLGVREWTTTEIGRGLSKALMDGLGIHSQGEFVEIGKVRLKASDLSHPGRVEFEDVKPESSKPLGDSDLFVKRLETSINRVDEFVANLEKTQELADSVSGLVSALNLKREVSLEERREVS